MPDPSFRLVLRSDRPDRFELAASDPFGRALWRVDVDAGVGVFRDDRERWACRFDPASRVGLPRLDWGLAAIDLPPVLSGRLPLPPGEASDRTGGSFEFLDSLGRSWSGEADGEGISRWVLAGAEGRLSYRRDARGATLEDERSGIRVRWRRLAEEPLDGRLPALAEASRDLSECADADLS